jgi:hypothetical protein
MTRNERRALLGGVVLMALTAAAYWPAMRGGFVWDDEIAIVRNRLVVEPGGLYRLWLTTDLWDYWPVTYTTFWLEWRVWGASTVGYHVVNVLLHGAAAVLLWRVLRRLGVPGAWAAGLLFGLHPMNVEAVAWIVQCKTVLSGLLLLAAVWWWVRFEERRGGLAYAGALGAFVLSLLSKTSGVMWPLWLPVFAWWRRGRVTRRDIAAMGPFFAASVVLGLVAVWLQHTRAAGGEAIRDVDWVARVTGAGLSLAFYVGKAVVPVGLNPIYAGWSAAAMRVAVIVGALLIVAGFAAWWAFRARWGRGPIAAAAWFVLMLFPVLGVVDLYYFRFAPVADRFAYHALGALVAVVVAGVSRGLARARVPRTGQWVVVAVVAAVLFGLTWRQAGAYAGEETFWRATLAGNPDASVAYSNLGLLLMRQRRIDDARAVYEAWVAREPESAEAHRALGDFFRRTGARGRARRHLERAAELAPEAATSQPATE